MWKRKRLSDAEMQKTVDELDLEKSESNDSVVDSEWQLHFEVDPVAQLSTEESSDEESPDNNDGKCVFRK